MASGQVGRLSVRILPDTTRFLTDLKRVLERAERTLSAKIEANVEVNERSLANAKRQLSGLEANISANLKAKDLKPKVEAALHAMDADIPVGVNPSPSFFADSRDGVTFSTSTRWKPFGISPVSSALDAAATAPHFSWPSTTTSGTCSGNRML